MKIRLATLLCCLVLSACDSDDDARELRNRVMVATQSYNVVEIRSLNEILETGNVSALELWAGTDVPTDEQTEDAQWSSSDRSVATVSSAGLVTAVSDGTVTITAAFGPLSDEVELRVSSAPLTSLTVLAPVALNECDSVQLNASGFFAADGSERAITDSVTWSVSNDPATVGVFSATTPGLFRSSNAGSALITASRDDISAQATITVADNLQALNLTPIDPVITPSEVTEFSVNAVYSDSPDTPDVTDNATWSVSDTGNASVDNTLPDKGALTAISTSDITLQVVCGGIETTASFAVGDPSIVESISFGRDDNPFEFEFPGEELTVTLRAIATLQTQTQVTITEDVDWITESRNTDLLVLSNDSGSKGQLTVRGRGTITVRIEYDVDEFDDFDEVNSTFNTPTLTINVL